MEKEGNEEPIAEAMVLNSVWGVLSIVFADFPLTVLCGIKTEKGEDVSVERKTGRGGWGGCV
jgi:hypothetical protein